MHAVQPKTIALSEREREPSTSGPNLDVSDHEIGCRWIHGTPRLWSVEYCGATTGWDRTWCPFHREIVYVNGKEETPIMEPDGMLLLDPELFEPEYLDAQDFHTAHGIDVTGEADNND